MCSCSLRNSCAKPGFSHYTKSENALAACATRVTGREAA
jgi:hypothetical protein